MSTNNPPIFIIGCPRSGTTMLRLMLDSHENISCGPESNLLPGLSSLYSLGVKKIEEFGYDQDAWKRNCSKLFSDLQEDYLHRRSKKRWAEKTPKNTLYIDRINILFPDAQYIHIVRNPYDVVASFKNRWGKKSAANAPSVWVKHVGESHKYSKVFDKSKLIEVKYEDLTANPETVMKNVIEFLGEEWDDSVLDYRKKQHDGRGQHIAEQRRSETKTDSTIYQHRVNSGKSELDFLLRWKIQSKCKALMKEYGYQP